MAPSGIVAAKKPGRNLPRTGGASKCMEDCSEALRSRTICAVACAAAFAVFRGVILEEACYDMRMGKLGGGR
jgi:hypothetical protein